MHSHDAQQRSVVGDILVIVSNVGRCAEARTSGRLFGSAPGTAAEWALVGAIGRPVIDRAWRLPSAGEAHD
jgi:hypothetical protein